jgi:hypothetical protein
MQLLHIDLFGVTLFVWRSNLLSVIFIQSWKCQCHQAIVLMDGKVAKVKSNIYLHGWIQHYSRSKLSALLLIRKRQLFRYSDPFPMMVESSMKKEKHSFRNSLARLNSRSRDEGKKAAAMKCFWCFLKTKGDGYHLGSLLSHLWESKLPLIAFLITIIPCNVGCSGSDVSLSTGLVLLSSLRVS